MVGRTRYTVNVQRQRDGAFQQTNCILQNSGHCLQVVEDSKHNFEVVSPGTRNRKSVQIWNREMLTGLVFANILKFVIVVEIR
jgi:hypothetical protein